MPSKRLTFFKSRKTLPFFLILVGFLFPGPDAHAVTGRPKQPAEAREAIQGDRVKLAGGQMLFYAGIQAPPLQSLIPLLREYGHSSLAFNKTLVEGKKILVEWGPQIRDGENHLLGYVFLEDGTFVNEEILKAGHARRRLIPPNTLYAERFRLAELDARRQRRGLWKEEPENPYIQSDFIGEKSTKVFYYPTSPELDGIPEAHLIRFRSRVDAVAAGYKPCPTCREEAQFDDY